MTFQINDRVVYPAFGVGRIVSLMTKASPASETDTYYEVSGDKSTAWISVHDGAVGGLRALTRQDELAHFRAVLRSRPAAMNADFRKRQADVRSQLKPGTLQCLCEVVRDLTGRRWVKPLNESDTMALRRSSEALYQEWAAADGVSTVQATAEVSSLLRAGHDTFQV